MKYCVALLALVVITAAPVYSQEDAIPLPDLSEKLQSGWFGTIGGGVAAHDNSAFSDRLQSWVPPGSDGHPMVYRTEQVANVGWTLNAGAAALFSERYLVGLSGERVFFPTFLSITSPGVEQSEYTLSAGGGQIEFGYAVINDDATLVWPYVSGGYYGYGLEVTNNQTDSVPFFEGNPIAPGATASFEGAAPRIGLGVGLTQFLDRTGGLVLQARLNWGIMPSRPEWEQEGETVNNGGHTPCYCAFGLTVSVGGGSPF